MSQSANKDPEAPVSINIVRDIFIEASIQVAFQATLDELGPDGELPDGKPFPMKFEAWPGGRWFRDLGHGSGHLWGHVQVIKPPALIEICGPMFMSYPATNHLQYRLKEEAKGTRLTLTHRALGLIPPDHKENISTGWEYSLERIRKLAQGKK